jgi:hypothetical protein
VEGIAPEESGEELALVGDCGVLTGAEDDGTGMDADERSGGELEVVD